MKWGGGQPPPHCIQRGDYRGKTHESDKAPRIYIGLVGGIKVATFDEKIDTISELVKGRSVRVVALTELMEAFRELELASAFMFVWNKWLSPSEEATLIFSVPENDVKIPERLTFDVHIARYIDLAWYRDDKLWHADSQLISTRVDLPRPFTVKRVSKVVIKNTHPTEDNWVKVEVVANWIHEPTWNCVIDDMKRLSEEIGVRW